MTRVAWMWMCAALVALLQRPDPDRPPVHTAAAAALLASGAPAAQAAVTGDQLRRQVDRELKNVLGELRVGERRDLAELYAGSGGSALWLEEQARPSGDAAAALEVLAAAAGDGLSSADYDVPALSRLARSLHDAPSGSVEMAARFDVALSAAALRYLRDLHLGRVDPASLGWQIVVPAEGHDFARTLREALAQRRFANAVDELSPPLAQYRALREALRGYRTIAAAFTGIQPPAVTDPIRPGAPLPWAASLRRLLTAVGDLPPGDAPSGDPYDDALVAAVRRFQLRHGLDDDGVIGQATLAQLRVPLAWRVRQLELALERLRWLPDLTARRVLAVNIPMFGLWAWSAGTDNGPPAFATGIIVGKAVRTRTPVFMAEMQSVIFRPFWNIPISILRNETIPAIRKDPGYLAREGMEIVDGPADNSPVLPPTAENIARLGVGGPGR